MYLNDNGICLTRIPNHPCAQSSATMGGTWLAPGSTPRFSELPIFSLWSFLPSSPGKAPPTAHQQDPDPEQEGGGCRSLSMASPCLTLQSIGGEARPKAERRYALMSQDKCKVGVDKSGLGDACCPSRFKVWNLARPHRCPC